LRRRIRKKYVDLELQSAGGNMAQLAASPDIKTAVTVTPNALTVKDVALAKLNVKLSLREETPDKPIPAASRRNWRWPSGCMGPMA